MPHHIELLEEAKAAIQRVAQDPSVDAETRQESLDELSEVISDCEDEL